MQYCVKDEFKYKSGYVRRVLTKLLELWYKFEELLKNNKIVILKHTVNKRNYFFRGSSKELCERFPLIALARAFIENVQIAIACRSNSLSSRKQVRLFEILSVIQLTPLYFPSYKRIYNTKFPEWNILSAYYEFILMYKI